MERLPDIISVGLLTIIVIWLLCFYKRITKTYGDFLLFCFILFSYELTLLITGSLHINNHLIANLNTLVYTAMGLWVIGRVYKRYHQNKRSINIILGLIWLLISFGWMAENFMPDNSVFIFNPVVPGVVSVVITFICIYLVNVLIFAKSGSILKDPDLLIIAGMLIRSITFGFLMWFLNFDYGFDWKFLSKLLMGINVGICISDLIFLLATYRIINESEQEVRFLKS